MSNKRKAGAGLAAASGSAAALPNEEQCGADYNAALQRYYDTGTPEDHQAVLDAYSQLLIVARRERRQNDQAH